MARKKKTCFTGTKYSSFREAQEELELLGIASDTYIPEEASAPGASVKGQCRNMERMPSNRHVKQGVYFRTNLSHFSFCRYFLLGSSPQKFGARTEYSNPLLWEDLWGNSAKEISRTEQLHDWEVTLTALNHTACLLGTGNSSPGVHTVPSLGYQGVHLILYPAAHSKGNTPLI